MRGERVQTMRRTLTGVVLGLVGLTWVTLQARQAAPSATPAAMLTVDSIMRGPKLVGAAPTNVRWSKDSSKIYFSWQKAGEDRASQYVVNRDGSGLEAFTGTPDTPAGGRFDRARKRAAHRRQRRHHRDRRRDGRAPVHHAHGGARVESAMGET